MLRPQIFLGVINMFNGNSTNISDFTDLDTDNIPFYKYIVKVESVDIEEDIEGVSVKIETKSDRVFIKNGDKLILNIQYNRIEQSQQKLPVLVVTDYSINADGTYTILAIDEFSYYIRTTTFSPQVNPTKKQADFLLKYFNYRIGDEFALTQDEEDFQALNIPDLFKYLSTRIGGLFFYNTNPSNLFYIDENVISAKTNLGKFSVGQGVVIYDVIKILRDNFYLDVYSYNYSYYNHDNKELENKVIVQLIGNFKYFDNEMVEIVDNVNIINDELSYRDPQSTKAIYIDEYTNSDGTMQSIYGYYDGANNPVVTTRRPDAWNFLQTNYFKIRSNADAITEEDRLSFMNRKLTKNEYVGYDGSFDTFFLAINIRDVINLTFNNSDIIMRNKNKWKNNNLEKYRKNGSFFIKSLKKEFNKSGLFMTVNLKNEVKL